MRKLIAFEQMSLDGYFSGANGDLTWAHQGNEDPEWKAFVSGNASGGGTLVFGRVTYQMMAGYWPTPAAMKNDPAVAEGMNNLPKIVFSRTLDTVAWKNTRLVKGDLLTEVRKMKQEPGDDMVILGSGSLVSQLASSGLIDAYQLVLSPLALGKGRSMFEGIRDRLDLKLTKTRTFANGKVVLDYQSTP